MRRCLFSAVPLLLACAPAVASGICDYDIDIAGAAATALEIHIQCDTADPPAFTFADPDAAAFIERLADVGSRAHFRIDLDRFAATGDRYDSALRLGRSVLVSPGAILPRPMDPEAELRLRLSSADGAGHAVGLPVRSDGRYEIPAGAIGEAGEWVLGQFDTLQIGGQAATVAILDARRSVSNDDLRRWIEDVAAGNRRFWGADPVSPLLLVVLPAAGKSGLPFGRVMAAGGATVLLLLGEAAGWDQLYREWVLVHEFLHLGTPLLRDTGIWFNEGIATYFEPILRARAGWKSEDEVWHEWLTNMPRSLPALTETGLMNAPSRRAYYGGALFMLLADIELRRGSAGAIGIEDCLRTVLDSGQDIRIRWPTRRMLETCDRRNGQGGVLASLAAKHVYGHAALDLDDLWRRLGVAIGADGGVRYDDSAPLAAVRRAIVWGKDRYWTPIGTYRAPGTARSFEAPP